MDLGLERVTRLLEALAPPKVDSVSHNEIVPPHRAIPIIHVAGTNGKGSICAYIASIFQASGYRVGRYNSPHLVIPRDTIQINSQPISQADYEYVTQVVQDKDAALGLGATSFELLTTCAFYWFAYGRGDGSGNKERVDVAVIEVGVGGLLDATNVVDRPEACVIASIGMDHAGLLGNTIQEVAVQKAGIIKKGAPVVVAPQVEGDKVLEVFQETASRVGASSITRVKAARWTEGLDSVVSLKHPTVGHWATVAEDDGDFQFWIPLLGDFQLENAATAIATARILQSKWRQITDATIQEGIQKTVWPGRLQWIDSPNVSKLVGGPLLMDGAHNPAAAIALYKYIQSYQGQSSGKGNVHWIMAFTKGKDIEEMFEILFPGASLSESRRSTLAAVEFSAPEGMSWVSPIPSEEICQRLGTLQERVQDGAKVVTHSFGSDLKGALEWTGQQRQAGDLVVLCGSLYLVADLFRLP